MNGWVGRIFKAGFRSFFFTLFLATVFAPIMTVVLIPRVGLLTAPFVCPDGTMDHETVYTQVSEGTNAQTTYYCSAAGERTPLSYWNILAPFIVLHIAFFFFLVWPFTYAIMFFRSGRNDGAIRQTSPWPTNTVQSGLSTIVVNGQQYDSPSAMPPAIRQQYEQAMAALPDANRDGIPDVLQGIMPDSAQPGLAQDAGSRLEALQGLRDQGLISESEYQQKRSEILSEL